MLTRICFHRMTVEHFAAPKFLRIALVNCTVECVRCVSGAPRRKPTIARIRPHKTASMLALDHFDFYYGPLFNKKWPSIRLGLLSPNKFVAVVNRFSKDYETNTKILQDHGTINLVEQITKGKESPSERIERKRLESTEKTREVALEMQKSSQTEADSAEPLDETPVAELGDPADEVARRIDSSALGQFRENKKEFAFFELKRLDGEERHTKRRIVRDSEFRVTGLEGISIKNLPVVEDFIYYPRDLNLQVYDRGIVDDFPGPVRDQYGISSWWLLDGGSVLPVLALDLEKKDAVLDMCAAPGGKSLMIIQSQRFSSLVCNDGKLARLGQLRRGLAMYVPDNCEEASKITIKRKDASTVEGWDELDTYDKVLVDAPCSTDRISATQDEHNLFNTVNTTERLDLPILQTRLLVNALRSVRVGGSVVYSTCTLAPTQNECVVENAAVLAEQYYGIRCVEQSLKHMEQHLQTSGLYWFSQMTKRGMLVLPTILSNFGPMYVCKLKRLR